MVVTKSKAGVRRHGVRSAKTVVSEAEALKSEAAGPLITELSSRFAGLEAYVVQLGICMRLAAQIQVARESRVGMEVVAELERRLRRQTSVLEELGRVAAKIEPQFKDAVRAYTHLHDVFSGAKTP